MYEDTLEKFPKRKSNSFRSFENYLTEWETNLKNTEKILNIFLKTEKKNSNEWNEKRE